MKIYANRTTGSELDKYVGNDMWILASVKQCELIDRTISKLGGHSFDWYCWIKLLYTRDGYYYFNEVGTPFRTTERLPNAVPVRRVSWADRKLEKPRHMRATADNIKLMHPIEMYSDEELFSEGSEE